MLLTAPHRRTSLSPDGRPERAAKLLVEVHRKFSNSDKNDVRFSVAEIKVVRYCNRASPRMTTYPLF